jgi:hypothetical protein
MADAGVPGIALVSGFSQYLYNFLLIPISPT